MQNGLYWGTQWCEIRKGNVGDIHARCIGMVLLKGCARCSLVIFHTRYVEYSEITFCVRWCVSNSMIGRWWSVIFARNARDEMYVLRLADVCGRGARYFDLIVAGWFWGRVDIHEIAIIVKPPFFGCYFGYQVGLWRGAVLLWAWILPLPWMADRENFVTPMVGDMQWELVHLLLDEA